MMTKQQLDQIESGLRPDDEIVVVQIDVMRDLLALTKTNTEFIDNGDLIPGFIKCMAEITEYGYKKHKENSFQHAALTNDRVRKSLRMISAVFQQHSREHFKAYNRAIKHDHFNTLRHQLAAVAVNAMMEYYYADLDNEK